MRHRQPRGWDPALTFLAIGGIIVLACLLLGPRVMGADWRTPYNFPAVYDTAYTCFYEDFVLDDSSLGRADDNDYDTIFTYTAGSYLRCILWYKYDASDEWATWILEYNSASASALDSAKVNEAMVDAATDNPDLFLGGVGTAPYGVTIVTYDSTISQTIPGVAIIIRSEDQSNVAGFANTNTEGDTTFNLSIANYVVIASVAGWTFPAYDTIEVSGTQEDTIYGDQFAPDAPSGGNLCAVYGWLDEVRDIATTRIKRVEVCFTPTAAVRNSCDDTWLASGKVCVVTDDNGRFIQNLLYSSCMLDGNGAVVQYKVTIKGDDRETFITVPDADNYRITWE